MHRAEAARSQNVVLSRDLRETRPVHHRSHGLNDKFPPSSNRQMRFFVPLSEEEQKMLEEIERSFYDSDPDLARTVGLRAQRRPSRIPTIAGVAGIVGGLALVILGLSRHVAISYVGFLAMLAGSFALVGRLRQIAQESISALTHRLIDTSAAVQKRAIATNRERRRRTDGPQNGPDAKP